MTTADKIKGFANLQVGSGNPPPSGAVDLAVRIEAVLRDAGYPSTSAFLLRDEGIAVIGYRNGCLVNVEIELVLDSSISDQTTPSLETLVAQQATGVAWIVDKRLLLVSQKPYLDTSRMSFNLTKHLKSDTLEPFTNPASRIGTIVVSNVVLMDVDSLCTRMMEDQPMVMQTSSNPVLERIDLTAVNPDTDTPFVLYQYRTTDDRSLWFGARIKQTTSEESGSHGT